MDKQGEFKSKKILIETGSDFGANKGDEAYFAAMVDLFREHIPGIEIVKFEGRPEEIGTRYNIKTIYSGGKLKRRLKTIWKSLREIATTNGYVWGGGQLLLDEHGFISVPYRLSRPLLARIFRRPVMSYAVGVGPLTGHFSRWISKMCLKKFSIITVRDAVSEKILRDCGVTAPIIQTIDAALVLESAGKLRAKEILNSEGIPTDKPLLTYLPWGPAFKRTKSVMPVIFRKGKAIRDEKGKAMYDRHVRLVGEALKMVSASTGATVLFIPTDPHSSHGGDLVMATDIARHMESSQNYHILSGDYPPKEIKAILGLSDLAVGSRMHGLILAAGEGVPLVGISFSDKIRCFGEIIQQERFFVDEFKIDSAENLSRIIRSAWDEREILKRNIMARKEVLSLDIIANVERLALLLEGKRN